MKLLMMKNLPVWSWARGLGDRGSAVWQGREAACVAPQPETARKRSQPFMSEPEATRTTVRAAYGIAPLLFLALTLVLAAPAVASPVTWTLVNASFGGAGAANGSLIADADAHVISNWNIAVTGMPAAEFDSSFGPDSTGMLLGNWLIFADGGSALFLAPDAPFTDAGGTLSLTGFYADSVNGAQFATTLVSGQLQSVTDAPAAGAVPEPTTWLLFGTSLLGLLLLGYRGAAFKPRSAV